MQQRTGSKPARKKPGRVSLPASQISGLPDAGSPFTGISGTNAPARHTDIPHLTAQVELAKARRERVTQGGILSPEQRAAEQKAARVLAKPPKRTPQKASKPLAAKPLGDSTPSKALPLPNTAPFKVPPPSAPAPVPPLPSSGRRGTLARAAGRNVNRGGTSGGIGLSGLANALTGPLIGHTAANAAGNVFSALNRPAIGHTAANATGIAIGDALNLTHLNRPLAGRTVQSKAGDILADAAKGIDYGAGTGAGVVLASLGIGDPSLLTKSALKKSSYINTTQAASRLSMAGLNLPKVIPSLDLVAPAGAASTTMTPQKLVAAGLDEAQTKKFRAKAIEEQHWYPEEINGLVGLDLIAHAYSPAPHGLLGTAQRVLKNAAGDVITTGTLPTAGVAIGREAVGGHIGRAVSDLGNIVGEQVGGLAANPVQYAISHPYYTASLLGGAAKTAGEAGRLRPGAPSERVVNLATTGNPLERGPASKNLYNASGQLISDVVAGKSPRYARRLEAQQVDRIVRSVTNKIAPEHVASQVDYAHALKNVGKDRAAILQAYQHAGGKPEQVLAHYERQAAIDGPKSAAAGQVKFYRDKVIPQTKKLDAADNEFLSAHHHIAHNTSLGLQSTGKFGETAATYRAHEPLIISAAHAGDPLADRILGLRDEYLNHSAQLSDEAHAALEGAYSHAVDEFAQRHLDLGGLPPTRVAYAQPTPLIPSPFTPGPGSPVRFSGRVTKQKASTGGSFESGRYLVNPTLPVRENIQAQRLRTSLGAHAAVMEQLGVDAPAGTVLPPGYVAVSTQNARALKRLQNDLQDNPVSSQDYYHQEAEARSQFAHALEGATKKPIKGQTWSVPRGEHYTFIPEGSWNRVMDYTKPQSRGVYDKFMRQYQRVLISTSPSTILGNTLGSVPMALAAGAGPKSFAMAARAAKDPTLAPFTTAGHGVTGALNAADASNPLTKGMAQMRRPSIAGEDFTRRAAYFAKTLPRISKEAAKANMTIDEYARGVAKGEINPKLQNEGLDWAIKFTGDMGKPEGALGRKAGHYILFHNWLGHVAKLMLHTLPIEHPRRLAFINALGQYGDQYRKEHGAWPSWMQDFLPLFQHVIGKNTFTRVAGTGQLTPQNTIGGFLDTLSSDQPAINKASSLLSPPYALGADLIRQEYDNLRGNGKPVSLARLAAHDAAYMIPYVAKARPRTGYTVDSIPFLSERRKTYTNADRKTKWNPNTLKWEDRPGARPVGGIEGFLSRFFGIPLYDVPNEGPINETAVKKEIKYDKPKAKGWGSWGG